MIPDERIFQYEKKGKVKLIVGQEITLKQFIDRDKKSVEGVKATILNFTDGDDRTHGTFRVQTVEKFESIKTEIANGQKTSRMEQVIMSCNIGSITEDSFTTI